MRAERYVVWEYDKVRYVHRNKLARFFLRLKRFRKIFTRYDKLDTPFAGFIFMATTTDTLISVNRLWLLYRLSVVP
jgi:transposase